MLRKIYYWLPPALRLWVRRLVYLPRDLFRGPSEMPPEGLIYTGSGDFKRQGAEWVQFFRDHGGLKPDSDVLDIGSGIGRMALPLSRFLEGRYEGFEAMKVGVDWCREHIEARHANFHFKHVPLFNDLYNSDGIDAAAYVFEYPDDSFDFACAISVFTHMTPGEVENYLRQTKRVLREGGHLTATFFILDEESEAMSRTNPSGFVFRHDFGHYALMDKKVKSANVAFRRAYLEQLVKDAGFERAYEVKGAWCGREKGMYIGFQDVWVLRAIGAADY